MNRQAKKTLESFLVVGLFAVVIFGAFVFAAALPYVIFAPDDTHAPNSTWENASQNSAKFFNITINWSQAAATTLVQNNISQINISLPSNFTFLAGELNGTSAFDDVAFTNLSFSSDSSNISMVLSWSNFTGILVNASINASFWFNATPSTAGWFNITVSMMNATGEGAAAYAVHYFNLSVFVNATGGSEKFINATSGATVPAGANFSMFKSGMNYSGNFTMRITGTVDYPEILRIEITNGSTNGAVITNLTGNQTTAGAGADGYWYRRINSSIGTIANASNGSSMFYNFTIVVREATHNLSNYTVFSHIRFDATKPIVQSANISAPLSGGNYSQNITLNVTGTDATGIIGFWNFTNATAAAAVALEKQNATVPITRSSGNIMIADFNTTSIGDGYWNISFFANDTAGNSNNHSDTYAGAPKVTNVVIDNTAPSMTLTRSSASTKNSLVISIAVTDWPANVSGKCTHDRGDQGSISGSGAGTQTYTETEINCGNSVTVAITCNDYAGNRRTSSITASTDSCTGGDSTSGSGGGETTTTTWTQTFNEADKELSEKGDVSKSLGSSQRVKLKLSGEDHYVGVKEVASNGVTIEISSTPQSATLKVGDERRFDVDADGVDYDLYVKLNSITNNKADLTIKAISEEITEETVAAEQQMEEGAAEATGLGGEEGVGLAGTAPSKARVWVTVIVVLVIVIVVVFFVLKRKK